jgi:hypothetical protein
VGEIVNLGPKLAADVFVRLGGAVEALGKIPAEDVRRAVLAMKSTEKPVAPLEALDCLILALRFIREKVASEGSRESAS